MFNKKIVCIPQYALSKLIRWCATANGKASGKGEKM